MAGVSERAYLDPEEFIDALRALEPAELLRLRKKSTYRAPGTGLEGDDLLNEAVRRTLEAEGRNCPAGVPVALYLDNAMRSIASTEREKYARESPAGGGNDEEGPIGSLADCNPSPADAALGQIELQRIVDRLEDMFADDLQAQAIVIGDMEGWSPDEIRELESMDDKQYVAARRRVRRAIERELGGE